MMFRASCVIAAWYAAVVYVSSLSFEPDFVPAAHQTQQAPECWDECQA